MNTYDPARLPVLPESAPEDIDLRELLGMLVAGRWVIAGAMVVALACGGLYLWLAPPIYRSDALVQVELKEKSINAALGEVGELLSGEVPVPAEIEIIRSRMVIGKVVQALGLETRAAPDYLPVIGRPLAARYRGRGPAPPLLGLDRYAWGGEVIRVPALDVPPPLVGAPLTLVAHAAGYELLDPDGRALLAGTVGRRATADTAYGPVSIFVAELQARPGTRFELERRWLANVIAEIEANLNVAEKGRQSGILGLTYEGPTPALTARVLHELVTAYQKQNVERRSAEAAQTLEFLQEQLPVLRKELEESEAELNRYRLQRGSADLTKETELVLQQSVAMEQNRLLLEQKRAELLQRFTPRHPVIEALNAQLASIQREAEVLAQQVKDLPETQQELLRLARDVQVNTALYTSLLNSAQELQVVKAGTVGNVRIIDYPQLPLSPAKPQRALTLFMSSILGIVAGMALVFVLRSLHRGIYDPAAVERALGLPTYAMVPYSPEQRRIGTSRRREKPGRLLAATHPESQAVEALRSLRTALHFALVEARNNVVMFTGPTPGLGKSFVCINLGAVVAQAGKRVLVIDADMRRGNLHSYAGIGRAPGLSDYIAGAATLDKIVFKTPVEHMHLMPSGTIPPNPAELLLHERVGTLVELARRYDYVLLDTPPVLPVTDAAVIGRLAGSTLLVLKAGEHPLRMVEDCLRRLSQAGVAVRGTIFNQLGGKAGYGHAYGPQYAYSYEYNSKQ